MAEIPGTIVPLCMIRWVAGRIRYPTNYSGGILGADNEFQKYSADTSWYYSGWWNHVIAVHARAGYMLSKSTDSYFLFYERFFLGGVDTIRGYEDYEIYPDPDESGDINPYGGDKVFFANFEYRVPISQQLTASPIFRHRTSLG